jgi:uncharacterized protein (DUF1330 family)
MRAFVIVEISIQDHQAYEEYKKLTPVSIAAYDGKFIVRGGQHTMLEGDWNPERIVILEFPSVKRANEWWNSKLYEGAKEIRKKAAKTKMIIVEGI